MADRRAFALKYNEYVRECQQASDALGYRIVARPVGTCIEARSKQFAAQMHLGAKVDDVTNGQWAAYFVDALVYQSPDYGDLVAKIRTTVLLDETDFDLERSYDKWMMAYWGLLERNNMMSFHEKHPQKAVEALVHGIRPLALKQLIKTKLDLDHKHLRNSVLSFFDFVKEELRHHLKLARTGAPSGLVKVEPRGASDRASLRSADINPRQKQLKPASHAAAGKKDSRGQKAGPRTNRPDGTDGGAPRRLSCWGCKGAHSLWDCTTTSEADRKAILEKMGAVRPDGGRLEANRHARGSQKALSAPPAATAGQVGAGQCVATIPGIDLGTNLHALLDSGGESSGVASRGLYDLLERLAPGSWGAKKLARHQVWEGFGKVPVLLNRHFVVPELSLQTPSGPFLLTRYNVWIDETDPGVNLTIGLPVMEAMGYSTQGFLDAAVRASGALDLGHLLCTDPGRSSEAHKAMKLRALHRATTEAEADDMSTTDDDDDAPALTAGHDAAVRDALVACVRRAEDCGLSLGGQAALRGLLTEHFDVFRLGWKEGDTPVKVEPLRVNVKPGAVPTACKQRRYSPLQTQFLERFQAEIVAHGLGYVNPRSRWASAPRLVPKKDGSFRMTIDQRGPNSCTEPMHWPMPVLEVVMARLLRKTVFFSLDWYKGYWQLPLHPESQELFTIMGVDGMITPTRVSMGQADAVAYCQSVAQEVYGDLYGNGVEAWLDDALGAAEDEGSLLTLLAGILGRCRQYNLKLNPDKCDFYATEVVWCGKKISREGVTHDPVRLQGLQDMPVPVTGRDLQQWVCALNWMRQSLPKFNELVEDLDIVLQRLYKAAGSNKATRLEKHLVADHGWGDAQLAAFAGTKAALANMVTLAHPDPEKTFTLFPDASHRSWGSVLTQIESSAAELPVAEQNHQPLAFLSGAFKGASLRWSTTEKEAYAIVASCRRLDYLLQRPGGFTICTDHRNLQYIFGQEPDLKQPRYLADKLARWAMILDTFSYDIRHIPGEANVWWDLLSR
jgi:hypothetical protein